MHWAGGVKVFEGIVMDDKLMTRDGVTGPTRCILPSKSGREYGIYIVKAVRQVGSWDPLRPRIHGGIEQRSSLF